MSKAKLLIVVTLLSACCAIYAAELVLEFPPAHLLTRLGIQNPEWFDDMAATRELRSQGRHVYPLLSASLQGTPGRTDLLVPLAGISHTEIVLCNETGQNVVITLDEHGFSNPDSVWNRQPAIGLVGDSFTLGECVGPMADVASHFRNQAVVLNAGMSDSGPLHELAILREYVASMKPARVFWLFYEGNDVDDLDKEKKNGLSAYLDPSFTQHLIERQPEIDSAVRINLDSSVRVIPPARPFRKLTDAVLLRRLRRVLHLDFHRVPEVPPDYETLASVLGEAKKVVSAWGGSITMVYLPERRRFDGNARDQSRGHHDLMTLKAHVLDIAARNGIPVIDVSAEFARNKRPLLLWATPRSHYTPAGYSIVAAAIQRTIEPSR